MNRNIFSLIKYPLTPELKAEDLRRIPTSILSDWWYDITVFPDASPLYISEDIIEGISNVINQSEFIDLRLARNLHAFFGRLGSSIDRDICYGVLVHHIEKSFE